MSDSIVRRKQTFKATRWFNIGDHPKIESLPETDPLHSVDGGDMAGAIYYSSDRSDYDLVQAGDYIIEDQYGNVFCITSTEFLDEYEPV